MRAAFPNKAYGLSVGGTKADVQKFTAEQVRDYYRNYYSPNNTTGNRRGFRDRIHAQRSRDFAGLQGRDRESREQGEREVGEKRSRGEGRTDNLSSNLPASPAPSSASGEPGRRRCCRH